STVPPPVQRRRIGIPSSRHVATLTSDLTRFEYPTTTKCSCGSQKRSISGPSHLSHALSNASSQARFSCGVGNVRSNNCIACIVPLTAPLSVCVQFQSHSNWASVKAYCESH